MKKVLDHAKGFRVYTDTRNMSAAKKTLKPLRPCHGKTLRSIRFQSRKAGIAGFEKFDAIHLMRLRDHGMIEILRSNDIYKNDIVRMTRSGHDYLAK